MKSETRDACVASLRAARLRQQPIDDYAPATQVGLLLERYATTREAHEAAHLATVSLSTHALDHFVWIGHAREHATCVERHLVAIVQEEARAATSNETETNTATGGE